MKFTVKVPDVEVNLEVVVCTKCRQVFVDTPAGVPLQCPNGCNSDLGRNNIFLTDDDGKLVSLDYLKSLLH